MPDEIDKKLDDRIMFEGSFSASLNWTDRQRLRKIVKNVHLKNYPTDMITDYEADKLIDVLAPETSKYLIEHHQKSWA